ncbi:MAG: hypothetical protein JSV00_05450 [bacterium]|nr:MAG: hypothetical protein JSV00_05450 [bacterium]
MDAVLRHRGGSRLLTDESPAGAVGVRPLDGPDADPDTWAGLYSQGDQAVALVGFLTNRLSFRRPLLPHLLDLYREEGPFFVKALRGAFILVVRDGLTMHLFRDGAGSRTVYYGRMDERFLFAVEPKGVLAAPGFPRRIRPGAVAQYLTFSFVPGAETMLEGLFELPPGHLITFRDGIRHPRPERYFVFETAPKEQDASEGEWVDRFRRVLEQAVAERLPDNGTAGVFLSGGIDSSVIAAEVARQRPDPVKTYAVYFGPEYAHELDFARAVAERTGTEHQEILIQPRDFLPRLRKIIWHLDDPIGDPITVPNFELSGRSAREVICAFNGEGGDPLFGGPKNIPMMLHHWYGGFERGPQFRERMYLASYRRCYDDLEQMLTPEWRQRYDQHEVLEGVLTPFFQSSVPPDFLDKLQVINILLKGAHLILPKVDRMYGAWGLRSMAPLFDERLVEMSFLMPNRLKLDRGVEKVILKKAYQDDLPPEVIARPKSGMRVPVHFWFQKEMRRYARKILAPKRIREIGIFNEKRVKQLLDYNIEEGPGRYGLRLWMLITFEIWRRIVIEQESP